MEAQKATLSREERLFGQRQLIILAVVGIAMPYSFGGAVQVLFAEKIGATASQIGLATAAGPLLTFLQIFFARLVHKYGKKPLLKRGQLLTASIPWSLFFVPYLYQTFGTGPAVKAMIIIYFAQSISSHLIMASWWPLIYDNLDASERGIFFGKLRMSWQMVALCYIIFVAFFFGEQASFLRFQVIFSIGAVLGLLRVFITGTVPEVAPQPEKPALPLLHSALEPFKNRRFRKSLIYLASIYFSQMLMLPFFALYMKRVLGLADRLTMIYTQVALLVGSFLSVIIWGYLADRFGNRPIYKIGNVGIVICFALWLFVLPGHTYIHALMPMLLFVLGVSQAAFDLANIRDIMGALPSEKAPHYFASFSIVAGLSAAAGPIVGGHLIDFFGRFNQSLALVWLDNFKVVALLAGFAAGISMVSLRGLGEKGERPAKEILAVIFARPFRTTVNLFQWGRALSEQKRLEVARALSETKSIAATKEFIESLNDPSFEVRQEAVWALGRLKDKTATGPLIEVMRDASLNLQHLAAWALGELRAVEAVDELARQLGNPDKLVRGNAALALGKIRSKKALGALLEALQREEDDFVYSSIAWALSRLKVVEVLPTILERASRTVQPLHRKRLLTIVGSMVSETFDFYRLVRSELRDFAWEVPRALRQTSERWKKKTGRLDVREHTRRIAEAYEREQFETVVKESLELVKGLAGEIPLPALERALLVISSIHEKPGRFEPWEKAILSVGALIASLEVFVPKG